MKILVRLAKRSYVLQDPDPTSPIALLRGEIYIGQGLAKWGIIDSDRVVMYSDIADSRGVLFQPMIVPIFDVRKQCGSKNKATRPSR